MEKQGKLDRLFTILGIVLIVVALFNVLQLSSISGIIENKVAEGKEAARPADIQLIAINDKNCRDCFNATPLVNSIKKLNVKITSENSLDLSSVEAKELVSRYNIEKIPAIILTGEINKTRINDMEQRDGALVFTNVMAPYTDAKSGVVMGKVSAILLKDPSCDKCTDVSLFITQLKKSGVKIVSERTVESGSDEGKSLIEKYSITKLPNIVLTKELGAYDAVIQNWNSVGYVSAGDYVTKFDIPPYFDMAKDKVVGIVSMTVLSDKSCGKCYDASVFHKPILSRIGVYLGEEKNVDASSDEGKALVEKYKIKALPTMILTGDVEEYETLKQAWAPVGTIESDGAYVFRKVDIAQQPYKDLALNKIVEPAPQTAAQGQ